MIDRKVVVVVVGESSDTQSFTDMCQALKSIPHQISVVAVVSLELGPFQDTAECQSTKPQNRLAYHWFE